MAASLTGAGGVRTMPMFEGDVFFGYVDVFLPPSSGGREPVFASNEIRISRRSPASDRCPPLAVLQVISAYSMRCKLQESTTLDIHPRSPFLNSLHSTCWNQRMTAVVDAGPEELHLVAMQSKFKKGVPCFWCWSAQAGLYEACLGMLNQRCIAIVFDLDETIIFASNEKKLETRMKEIKSYLENSELDAITQLVLQNQLCRVSTDNTFMKDFVHKDAITVNHEIVRSQHEKGMLYKPGGLQLGRPVIRVPKRNAVLTRLDPMDPRSSYFVNIRPGWDNLKTYLSKTSGCRKYKVYVCTIAARQYALEAWRLLDPEGSLISSEEISQRLVCVRPGSKKSLERVFRKSLCHPNMAMVIDDRMNVWDDKDKRRVHNLPAYNPSVAPEDKVVNGCCVLQILRNYILEVHKGFFSEFDGMLLKKVDGLMYENDGLDLVYTPDVGDYVELTNNKIVEHSDSSISPKNTKRAKGEVGARINGEIGTIGSSN